MHFPTGCPFDGVVLVRRPFAPMCNETEFEKSEYDKFRLLPNQSSNYSGWVIKLKGTAVNMLIFDQVVLV